MVWTLGTVSGLHHQAFDAELLLRELPTPPLTTDTLVTAARSLGYKVKRHSASRVELAGLTLPCIALLTEKCRSNNNVQAPSEPINSASEETARPALIVQLNETHVLLFRAGTNQPVTLTVAEFDAEFTGTVFQFAPPLRHSKIPIAPARSSVRSGFDGSSRNS